MVDPEVIVLSEAGGIAADQTWNVRVVLLILAVSRQQPRPLHLLPDVLQHGLGLNLFATHGVKTKDGRVAMQIVVDVMVHQEGEGVLLLHQHRHHHLGEEGEVAPSNVFHLQHVNLYVQFVMQDGQIIVIVQEVEAEHHRVQQAEAAVVVVQPVAADTVMAVHVEVNPLAPVVSLGTVRIARTVMLFAVLAKLVIQEHV